jgi:hypothetical protein
MQFLRRSAVLFSISLLAFAPLRADTNKTAPKPPEDQKLQAVLIWATDEEKPSDQEKELKDLEPALKDKIKFLKWKNYFEVGERKSVVIRSGETKALQLSHKCQLKLHYTDKEGLQVELIGDNKPVWKKNQTMPGKDILIIGGDDKNSTAWLVALKSE